MGRNIGVAVAVLIWLVVVLAARGLVMGADDPIDAVRCQGEQLLSQWFGISSVTPGGGLHIGSDGLAHDTYRGWWALADGAG